MRIALFSDVHANLPALEAVLDHIHEQSCDSVYCLGDLVGYAPLPNEVVERQYLMLKVDGKAYGQPLKVVKDPRG